ncbi:hypothetical protein [Halorussus salinus]|uniref:hypothetical protein n=1 Tax=Halorussus salinus TaxID=1364935 RepID=UPI0010931040|nr:hypothetical protein [Halorussus salinus]
MAILEINLEKPALIEEYQFPAESSAGHAVASESAESEATDSGASDSGGSGGSKGKLVGLLAVAAGVGLLVWKLKNRGGDDQTDFDEFETDDESEADDESPEWEIEEDGGSSKGKVAGLLGLVVAAVGLVVAVQKRRN